MKDYELMVIIDPTTPDEEIPNVLEAIKQNIAAHGGEAGEPDTSPPWGRRRLAYPIRKHNEGFYAVLRFRLSPSESRNLDRDLKLNDRIMRFLITRTDK